MAIPVNSISPEPRRFSIRLSRSWCLGLLMTVLAVALVAFPFGLPILRQQSAIWTVERLGGSITIRENGPEWLRSVVGDEWMRAFDDVHEVHLRESQITDDELENLKRLTSLEGLDLRGTQVTDAGLVSLKGLTDLQGLNLDAGLVHLTTLNNLKQLSLVGTQISDKGLNDLMALSHLEGLRLWDTKITEAGVAELKQALPNTTIAE